MDIKICLSRWEEGLVKELSNCVNQISLGGGGGYDIYF